LLAADFGFELRRRILGFGGIVPNGLAEVIDRKNLDRRCDPKLSAVLVRVRVLAVLGDPE
jgi:hypothetical protein